MTRDLLTWKVESLMQYQEKLDAIAKLEGEIHGAKLAAVQASPRLFGINAGSPNLGLGDEGLHGLAQRGGDPLAHSQKRLAEWLRRHNSELAAMSEERREYYEKYVQMEEHLRHVMDQNRALQEENKQLGFTIRNDRHASFDRDHVIDGSKPYYVSFPNLSKPCVGWSR